MTTVKSRLRRLLNVGNGANPTTVDNGTSSGNLDSVIRSQQEGKEVDKTEKTRNNFRILSSFLSTCDESTAENSSLASSVNSGTSPSDDEEEVLALGSTFSGVYIFEGSDPYADVRSRMEALRGNSTPFHSKNANEEVLFESSPPESTLDSNEELEKIPTMIAFFVYVSYAMMIMVGHIRDFFGNLTGRGRFVVQTKTKSGLRTHDSNASFFAPLLKNWENFYKRRLYMRLQVRRFVRLRNRLR